MTRALPWAAALVLASVTLVPARATAAACDATQASDLYQRARQAFEAKRFGESVELLRQAYACNRNPVYLANIARAYEEGNLPRDALGAWRTYLDAVTDDRERAQVVGRISALSKLLDDLDRAEQQRAAAEAARRQAEASAQVRERATGSSAPQVSTFAWVTASVGAGGLVGGIVLAVLAGARHDAAVQEPNVTAAEGLQSDAHTFATAANWAFAGGGVVLAAGAAWITYDLLRASNASPTSVAVRADVRGLSIGGIFE